MKSKLRRINAHGISYDALMFVCPGCVAGGPAGYEGVHILAINDSSLMIPSWGFNGNLEEPTLSPSILTNHWSRCHSFLEDGLFRFLPDSDHDLAGQQVPIPDLPDWVVKESYV